MEGRLGSFEGWWMDNDDPTTRRGDEERSPTGVGLWRTECRARTPGRKKTCHPVSRFGLAIILAQHSYPAPGATARWSYFDFSVNSTQPEAVALKALNKEVCPGRHCQTLGGEFVLFALVPTYPGINFGG